ncbi:hypothetical protein Sste5344_009964 [Sporothrix stenoceras]
MTRRHPSRAMNGMLAHCQAYGHGSEEKDAGESATRDAVLDDEHKRLNAWHTRHFSLGKDQFLGLVHISGRQFSRAVTEVKESGRDTNNG